jgi:AcrR family transcriptional regulator
LGTRERILDAATQVLRTRGIAHATTKQIAKAAGYSEATLYKHFRDKSELLLCVLQERLPRYKEALRKPGQGTLEDNLTEITRAALAYYCATFPMLGSILSDTSLLAAHRESLRPYGAGPENAVKALAAYLRAERDLGRVAPDTDPDAAAALLIGACFHTAFLRFYAEGPDAPEPPEHIAVALARTFARTLSAGGGRYG